jgi:hypothetical protein
MGIILFGDSGAVPSASTMAAAKVASSWLKSAQTSSMAEMEQSIWTTQDYLEKNSSQGRSW